ncbi:MAG: hypothetical protein P8P70_13790 [Sulfitobacter sp.]|nr:hypothetical protein [Sulfitobacter sp.]
MRHFSDYIALFIRMTAGFLLVMTGLQPLDVAGIHDLNPVIPVYLQSTNVFVLDVMMRGMFAMFGIAILEVVLDFRPVFSLVKVDLGFI